MPLYFYRNDRGEKGIKRVHSRDSPPPDRWAGNANLHLQECHHQDPRAHPLKPRHARDQSLLQHMPRDLLRNRNTEGFGNPLPGINGHSFFFPVRNQQRHNTTMSINGDSDSNEFPGGFNPARRGRPGRNSTTGPLLMAVDPFSRYGSPSIPLGAAARQLYDTVEQAIRFFQDFNVTFRTSVRDIRNHANKALLNSIWQSKIRSTIADAGIGGGHKEIPSAPKISFQEHQKLVLLRLQRLLGSRQPLLPRAAKLYNAYSNTHDPDYHDKEFYVEQQKNDAAEYLRRKIQNDYEDIESLVVGMGTDWELAQRAIRELKGIKKHLQTARKCWDGGWSDEASDGGDSDDERSSAQQRMADGSNGDDGNNNNPSWQAQ